MRSVGLGMNYNMCYSFLLQEDFLDLTVTVAGNTGLENGLFNSYVEVEKMDGSNQYRCEGCNKLVNASKVGIN